MSAEVGNDDEDTVSSQDIIKQEFAEAIDQLKEEKPSMDSAQDWQLLLSLLPHILALAEFYTGDDDKAVRARKAIGDEDPFYANLYTELQDLEANVESYGTSQDLPLKSIGQVLQLLDSQCFALTLWEKIWPWSVSIAMSRLLT